MYIQHYRRLRPPVILSVVGYSGHGKTVYLAALMHAMRVHLTRAWPKFYRQALDQASVDTVKQNSNLLDNGELPESTRRNFPRPSLHLLAEMPKYKTRPLVIYDPPGEAFEEDLRMERYASFVTRAKVVLFLISLADLDDPVAVDMYRLLEIYTLGMGRMKAKTRKQHLVVAYTKADLLLERYFMNHPNLVNHLQSSEINAIRDVRNYLHSIKSISNELVRFTANEVGARDFINLARSQFKNVSFCVTSALGSPPEKDRLSEAMQPRRVIDPLLCVLENS